MSSLYFSREELNSSGGQIFQRKVNYFIDLYVRGEIDFLELINQVQGEVDDFTDYEDPLGETYDLQEEDWPSADF